MVEKFNSFATARVENDRFVRKKIYSIDIIYKPIMSLRKQSSVIFQQKCIWLIGELLMKVIK